MRHFRVIFKPDEKEISIHAGGTLFEAAAQAGVVLNTICGGKGTCRKCAVVIEPAGQTVLACQYHIQSDITVTIPPESRFLEHKILLHGIAAKTEVQPTIYRVHRRRHRADTILGVAVDIGTTTVVAKLVDMTTGRCLGTEAVLNPQTRFGDDVVSRISYAQTEDRLTELHKVIVDCVNDLIGKLCRATGSKPQQIYEMCAVGNTTMNHLFLKYPVRQLGQAPYKAFSLDAHDLPPDKLNLKMNPAGNVHTVENIAGFVGSDTTAGALAVDIDSDRDVTLYIDIGTNGEVVLSTGGRFYAVSCAAGPAFEGARITYGSRAAEGAIEAVVLAEDDIDIDVIGNCPARSICGSGLIDAVAVMLNLGIVDPSGRFIEHHKIAANLSPAIRSRVIEKDGQPAFCLAWSDKTGGPQVVLTQKDIREVQLAKAAIRTGIDILLRRAGLEYGDIEHILLAGAFGSYIRRESAVRIGLLPPVPVERIRFVGNAAVSGAQIMLISSECRKQALQLARKIEYVELANDPEFMTVYADSMLFPPPR